MQLLIAVLFFMCWFGIKHKEKDNKIFICLLGVGFVNMIFDIVTNYTVNRLDTVHPIINRLAHMGFFVTLATMFMLVYQYLVALVEKELERALEGVVWSYIPYVIVLFTTTLLPVYYMETPSGNYSYGPGPSMLYVCVVVYMLLIINFVIRHRKSISSKNKIAVVLALISVLGASGFQFFVPVALTSSLGVVLFCLCMYMTVANPDAVLVKLLQEKTARADAANRAKSVNMDGVETLQVMKEKNLCGDTPVIMLTANAVVGAREQYLEAGFDDYLSKPISPEKLDKMILKYLPEELVKEGESGTVTLTDTKEPELPQLDEFDFSYAMNLLRSEELVMKTLGDFHNLLERLPGKLDSLFQTMNEQEQLALYRIEVHGLKSTAATVGALLLSKIARLLEVAAIEGDVVKITAVHPILLEEMEKHRLRIETVLPKKAGLCVLVMFFPRVRQSAYLSCIGRILPESGCQPFLFG